MTAKHEGNYENEDLGDEEDANVAYKSGEDFRERRLEILPAEE